ARAHPGGVSPAVLAKGRVGGADVADGDDAAGLTVDAQGRREVRAAVVGADVVDVPRPGRAAEVDHVDGALRVHHDLGLDALLGDAQERDLAGPLRLLPRARVPPRRGGRYRP